MKKTSPGIVHIYPKQSKMAEVSSLKRGINKKIDYNSPICPETPHGGISTKVCTAVEVVDLITHDNF